MQTVQGANWQRGGGKGKQPELISRPDDRPPQVTTRAELDARRQAQRVELTRRRAAKLERQRKGA